MLKKITAFICTLSFLTVPQVISSAAETDDAKSGILQGLGIVTYSRVNRENFINSLEALLYEDTSLFTAEDVAKQTGMIPGDAEYKGNDSITVSDAAQYAVVALGYKTQAELDGSYLNVAAQLGLMKGISDSGDKKLSYDNAVKLLYNMLDVAPMQKIVDGTGTGYWIDPNTNLLEVNHDIYKIYGFVTADTNTSLYSDTGRYETEYVLIDDIEYLVGNSNADLYLGHNVVVYAKETTDDEMEIIYICDRSGKNDILEITAEDIDDVSDDLSYIEYYDGEKVKKAKLDSAVSVIYNGVSYGGYTSSDLMPDVGGLAMVDNDSDGKYDVVKVTSYETMVVGWADGYEYTLRNKYEFDGCISELKIENIDDTNLKVYAPDGTETKFSSIKAGSIISVAKSMDGSVMKIYISGDKGISGSVTGIDKEENIILIDDIEYRKSADFDSYLESKSKELKIGDRYVFYTDYFGNIAYVEDIVDTDYKLVQKMYADDEKHYLVYMDLNGAWYTTEVGAKVTVDGSRITAEEALVILKKCEPQLMKITLNSKGEVNTIDIAELSDIYIESEFTKTSEKQYTYRTARTSLGMILYPTANATVVVIPQDTTDKDGYYIRKSTAYFGSDRDYNVVAYDVDEYGCVSVMTVKETEDSIKNLMSKNMFVVTGIAERLSDGEVLPVVEGYVGVYKNMTVVGSTADVFNDVNPGDIINININTKGRADYVSKVTATNTTNYYQRMYFIEGTILGVDTKKNMIKFQNGTTVSNLRLPASVPVIYYDREENECRDEKITALKVGDEFIMRSDFGNILEIVCFE